MQSSTTEKPQARRVDASAEKMKRADKILQATRYTREANPAIAALVDFAAQNPGLDPRNYFDPKFDRDGNGRAAFNEERANITADFRRFRLALAEASQEGVSDADVIAEAPSAFSGRLEWLCPTTHADLKSGIGWSYCTGQYFPTEYRKAAATLLEYALAKVRRERPPVKQMPRTIAELKARNKENGGHYFDASTMRFFRSKIESGILSGCYFVTSEQFDDDTPRKYSLRRFDDRPSINSAS